VKKKTEKSVATTAVERPNKNQEKDARMSVVVDVKGLAAENLPKADFPASKRTDFRVSLADAVHQGIWKHASEDTSVEICGVLVGLWSQDDDGPYASVTEYIRCAGATQKFAEVTFTHESWAQINKEMDSKYQDLRIIGWYHSHPNFGIFLSDRDGFIQQNFFSNPGQIAMVVDPVRKIEGIFIWRNNKTAPLTHFWVGDKIKQGAGFGTQDESMTQPAAPGAAPGTTAAPVAAAPRDSFGGWFSTLLAFTMFLLGWMLAGKLNLWEQEMIQRGAVAHYGIAKLYKPGFEDRMHELMLHQTMVQAKLKALEDLPPSTDENVIAEKKKVLASINDDLRQEYMLTRGLLDLHGLNDAEKEKMAALIAQKSGARDHKVDEGKPAAPQAKPLSPLMPPAGATPPTSPAGTTPMPTATTPSAPAATAPAPASTAPTPAATSSVPPSTVSVPAPTATAPAPITPVSTATAPAATGPATTAPK